jgi:ABC-type transporter Mla subunit MlaD
MLYNICLSFLSPPGEETHTVASLTQLVLKLTEKISGYETILATMAHTINSIPDEIRKTVQATERLQEQLLHTTSETSQQLHFMAENLQAVRVCMDPHATTPGETADVADKLSAAFIRSARSILGTAPTADVMAQIHNTFVVEIQK